MPPILTRDFTVILDAQKARGNEIEWVDCGLFTQIHRIAPLIIPVTIGSIMCGDNMVNAKACTVSNCAFALGSNY